MTTFVSTTYHADLLTVEYVAENVITSYVQAVRLLGALITLAIYVLGPNTPCKLDRAKPKVVFFDFAHGGSGPHREKRTVITQIQK